MNFQALHTFWWGEEAWSYFIASRFHERIGCTKKSQSSSMKKFCFIWNRN